MTRKRLPKEKIRFGANSGGKNYIIEIGGVNGIMKTGKDIFSTSHAKINHSPTYKQLVNDEYKKNEERNCW